MKIKYLMVTVFALIVTSCKTSYLYEDQQRGGDPYRVEWITAKGTVATCFIVDESAGRATASANTGLKTSINQFMPDGGILNIYNAKGILIEAVPIQKHIYFCSASGYTKIPRTKDISDLITIDYRDMSAKLIDHLKTTKTIP